MSHLAEFLAYVRNWSIYFADTKIRQKADILIVLLHISTLWHGYMMFNYATDVAYSYFLLMSTKEIGMSLGVELAYASTNTAKNNQRMD